MAKKEGKIVSTGVNPQGVPWKEISFIEEKPKENKSRKDTKKKINQEKVKEIRDEKK